MRGCLGRKLTQRIISLPCGGWRQRVLHKADRTSSLTLLSENGSYSLSRYLGIVEGLKSYE